MKRFTWLFLTVIAAHVDAVEAPRVVGVPPADAGRGLVRVSAQEIRSYPGKGGTHFLQSKDNGETWQLVPLPESYPDATCMAKEAPAIVQNPTTGEFLRVEPAYRQKPHEGMYISTGGLDGTWTRIEDADGKPILPSGILRTPLWVNNHQRIVLPAHGGGCWTWNSDDQGKTLTRSNKVQAPAHQINDIHKGTRWNHGMVEGTIVELKNKRLWMVARTAQDQHYETFSSDFGATWTTAKPSRFWGTITMPTFYRMQDGRLLFLWSNTTALPEVERIPKPGGEDVFTNRDALHAAISEDDGKTWIGFREVILDDLRNNPDYAVTPGSNDRGKHQCEVVQLDKHRVLLSSGQHPLHRKLVIMDVRWLYEKTRQSNLRTDGTQHWSTHQYVNKIVGHCGYNRTPGAVVKDDGLQVLRVDDEKLTNPNQGATWNFPSLHQGTFTTQLRLNEGGSGLQIALTDRWFNPTDHSVDQFAHYVLQVDQHGKTPAGKQVIQPGTTHTLAIQWRGLSEAATLSIDGLDTDVTLPALQTTPNGLSYVHFYNPATATDPSGFSIHSTKTTPDNEVSP